MCFLVVNTIAGRRIVDLVAPSNILRERVDMMGGLVGRMGKGVRFIGGYICKGTCMYVYYQH